MEAKSLLPDTASQDVEERLDTVIAAFLRLITATEAQQRTMLRLSLDPDPAHRGDLPLRQGRAIGWIGEALSPLRGRMPEADLRRLILAIRSAAGIEALVWLTDIAGLSRAAAVKLMRRSTGALLRSALADRGLVSGRARIKQAVHKRPGSNPTAGRPGWPLASVGWAYSTVLERSAWI